MCQISDFSHLTLLPEHRMMLENELEDWHRQYIPHDGLDGKNVLDLGAGCGETAQFFLNHGAASIHPIESDPAIFNILRRNFEADKRINWQGPFRIDFIKSDCEGGEKNMVIETHFPVHIRPLSHSHISCPCANVWRIEALDDAIHYGKVFRTWLFLHQLRSQINHYLLKLP